MPWTTAPPFHGFSTVEPWLPFDEQPSARNVEHLAEDETSTLSFYRRALALRRALRVELSHHADVIDSAADTVVVRRELGNRSLLVVSNFHEDEVAVPLERPADETLSSGRPSQVSRDMVVVPGETTVWLVEGGVANLSSKQ